MSNYLTDHTEIKKSGNFLTDHTELEDFVKGRVDDETLDRITHKADELQIENLNDEEKLIAEKATKLIMRDYGEVLIQLEEYERLEKEQNNDD